MKKKLLLAVLALVLMVSIFPSVSNAAATESAMVTINPYYGSWNDYWYNDYSVVVRDSNGHFVNPYSGNNYNLNPGSYTAELYIDGHLVDSENFYTDGYRNTEVTLFDDYYYNGRYYRDGKYWDRPIYNGGEISNLNVFSDRVSGTAAPYAIVKLYDRNGKVTSVTSDRYGDFVVYYDFADRYNYKYDDYRYWYGLEDLYLISNDGSKYYLDYKYVDGNKYDYYAPYIVEALGGTNYVTGLNAGPYGNVIVRDANGNYLGDTSSIGSKGDFTVKLNRVLISGETIKVTSINSRYSDRTTSVVVSGNYKENYDYNYITKFTIGSKKYSYTDKSKTVTAEMETAPYVVNGRTMLPLRYVAESLGYKVNWDNYTKNAVFIKGNDTAIVNLNSTEIIVNSKTYNLSVKPVTVNGRIMLPVSEIGMSLGLTHGYAGEGKNIEWDAANQIVTIQTYR